MGPIVALLVIAGVSLVMIRVGTLALVMTGLSEDSARFQALSAFFGVGYTTRESELVVNHPVRRRIISHLMVAGNIGLPTALAAGVVSFLGVQAAWHEWMVRLGVLGGCLLGMWVAWQVPLVRRIVDWLIRFTLRRAGVIKVADYDLLLHVQSGFSVGEAKLEPSNPMCGRKLADIRLRDHGVVVIGIVRAAGDYIGVPKGEDVLAGGDLLVVYGRESAIHAAFGVHDRGILKTLPSVRSMPPDRASPVDPAA